MPLTEITRRRGYSVVLLTAVLAAFVVAVPGSSLAAGSVSQAVPADTVVVAQSADPTTMDPQQQRDTPTFNVLSHFYDPLLMRDTADPRKFDPVLATSWKVISPTDVEFKLHTGVHFSDGSVFNAETVKYNVDRILGHAPGREDAAACLLPVLVVEGCEGGQRLDGRHPHEDARPAPAGAHVRVADGSHELGHDQSEGALGEARRDRALHARDMGSQQRGRDEGKPKLLPWSAEDRKRDLQGHARRRIAPRRARGGRRGRDLEPAARQHQGRGVDRQGDGRDRAERPHRLDLARHARCCPAQEPARAPGAQLRR